MARILKSLLVGVSIALLHQPLYASDLTSLVSQFSKLNLRPAELNFSGFLNNTKTVPNNTVISRLQQDIDSIPSDSLSYCESIVYQELRFLTQLAKERAEQISSWMRDRRDYQGQFTQFDPSGSWYRHWLKSWLMDEVSLDELERIAIKELEMVRTKRGLVAELELPQNTRSYPEASQKAIIDAFRIRETSVINHLPRVIEGGFVPTQTKITPSNLPKSFPAPGIYNPASQTFIYHVSTDTFPEKHMDWLYLHEAIPGHHYQSQFQQHNLVCKDKPNLLSSNAFSEGWGAYVETLGKELGLFNDSSSYHYALDWQALRATRVLIDIGIHAKGWSVDQAKSVWMQHIPDQQPIMTREINRIKNWPAQVITYVYGKAVIEAQARRLSKANPSHLIARIRADILAYPTNILALRKNQGLR